MSTEPCAPKPDRWKTCTWRDKIIFVENKKNFEEALETAEYSRYFFDNFGGDFGHGTRLGNELIARNLAGVIVTEVAGE